MAIITGKTAPTFHGTAIDGVHVFDLKSHPDDRGVFTEVFRSEWDTGLEPVQWNVVRSKHGVLRGVHVHLTHADYLTVVQGTMALGLRDMRPASPSYNTVTYAELDGEGMRAICIPPGVAHGFCFVRDAIHLYSVSHYWNLDDELGCRWDDPALEMTWPVASPRVSARDRNAGSYAALAEEFSARWSAK